MKNDDASLRRSEGNRTVNQTTAGGRRQQHPFPRIRLHSCSAVGARGEHTRTRTHTHIWVNFPRCGAFDLSRFIFLPIKILSDSCPITMRNSTPRRHRVLELLFPCFPQASTTPRSRLTCSTDSPHITPSLDALGSI